MLTRARWARIGVGLLTVLAAGALSLPAAAAAPENDSFSAAALLTGRSTSASGTNEDATKESGGASIWYAWTAPASGRTTLSTCDSDFDTLLAVYTGSSVAALDEVASDDDDCGDRSIVTFASVEGTPYMIAVDGKGGATGDASLELRLAPPNDDFADALPIAGDTGSASGTTEGAWYEDDEPLHYGVGWPSVWYSWTAPSTGWATFETCGSPFDTVLAAYVGAAVDALDVVAGSDDACGLGSRLSFEATAGTVYRIAVAGYDGAVGAFGLAWNRNPPPPEPPYAVDYPRISGVAREGDTLSTSDGAWQGAQPISLAFAWGRCPRDFGPCGLISGATSRTYVPSGNDVGWRLYVQVRATNVAGSSVEYSSLTPPVLARPPVNTMVPQVTGAARPGAILVASAGEWVGTAPISYTYQWQACDAAEVDCVDLPGEAAPLIRVSAAHRGRRLRIVVTGTNGGGSATALSDSTAMVRTASARRCVVPNVKGKQLAAARRAIRRAGCTPGRVSKTRSKAVRAGRVAAQSPRAGARRAPGTKVTLVLSKGKKR
jgi:PASTA domain